MNNKNWIKMESSTCKRCGKGLTSKESIKRGYGLRCFKITQLKASSREIKLENEINFLKYEIKMLKNQIVIQKITIDLPGLVNRVNKFSMIVTSLERKFNKLLENGFSVGTHDNEMNFKPIRPKKVLDPEKIATSKILKDLMNEIKSIIAEKNNILEILESKEANIEKERQEEERLVRMRQEQEKLANPQLYI